MMVGSIASPPLDHLLLAQRLEEDLAEPDAFDTEIGFLPDDILKIHFGELGRSLTCTFRGGRWSVGWGSFYRPEDVGKGICKGALKLG